jgi:hypothetical protein
MQPSLDAAQPECSPAWMPPSVIRVFASSNKFQKNNFLEFPMFQMHCIKAMYQLRKVMITRKPLIKSGGGDILKPSWAGSPRELQGCTCAISKYSRIQT